MEDQEEVVTYKKVRQYLISMDNDNLLGRGRLGQVRTGYQEDKEKLLVFKILPLPVSLKVQQCIDRQSKLSSSCLQSIQPVVSSNTKMYVPYEFLTRMLKDCAEEYRGNHQELRLLLLELIECYSYLLGLGLGHGNIKLSNLGFSADNKLKMTDLGLNPDDLEKTAERDMSDIGRCILELYYGKEPEEKPTAKEPILIELVRRMWKNSLSWDSIFDQLTIRNMMTKMIVPSCQDYHCHNRVVMLSHCLKTLNRQNQTQAALIMSIHRYIAKLIKEQLKVGSVVRSYRETLEEQLKRATDVSRYSKQRRHLAIRDALLCPYKFGLDKSTQAAILMSLVEEIDHQHFFEGVLRVLNEHQLQILVWAWGKRLDWQSCLC